MKEILSIATGLIVVASICQFAFSIKTVPAQSRKSSSIFVESSTNWIAIQELEIKAKEYVKKHDKKFNPDNAAMSVWIFSQGSPHKVLFTYMSGFGKPYWNIYFGSSGEVSKHENGILSEGAVQPKNQRSQ